ncbi:MAG: nucleoside deaminase [Deltaproteobacteria bacterium]|nr:nucleoside deaminase [Deltaproteobacteria bacterium]
MNHHEYMRLAIQKAYEGIKKGQSPFGACIVKNDEVISATHSHVLLHTDSTAHAEVQAIRDACMKLKTIDLSGCTIYSTCEPCPMCFSAIHWARISQIYYGATIADAKSAGFNELFISNKVMKKQSRSPVEVAGGMLVEENHQLFQIWMKQPDKQAY